MAAVKATAAAVDTPISAATGVTLPCEVVFHRPRNIQVVLVGAGGTGARLGPDIARLLSRGDKLIVVDPDLIEERNLVRQHFVRRDVGRYKAEVVAERATLAATPGVEVDAQITTLTNLTQFPNRTNQGATLPTLWIGAVDNRACRRMVAQAMDAGHAGLWIDAGNDLRGGQVGLMGKWQVASATDPNTPNSVAMKTIKTQLAAIERARQNREYQEEYLLATYLPWLVCNTIREMVPQILVPNKEEEEATQDCEVRLDTQSLAANVMAYACVVNLVSRIVDGLPVTSGGAYFSTANTMQAMPWRSLTGTTGSVQIVGSVTK